MKKAILILCVLALVISGAVVAQTLPPLLEYRRAEALLEQEDYAAALKIYEDLGGYRDSQARAEDCRETLLRGDYMRASAMYDAGLTEEALYAFAELGDYRDSAQWAQRCRALLEQQRIDAQQAADYAEAVALFEEKEYAVARDIFLTLGDYGQTADYLAQLQYLAAQPGDTFRYGSWPQNGEEPESIEWLVLDREDGRLLVVTLRALEAMPMTRWAYPLWEDNPLREYLNGAFFDTAFTAEEQARIRTVPVTTPEYVSTMASYWGGEDTEDRLFLLSLEEIGWYFPQPGDRLCLPTRRALDEGAVTGPSGGCIWWTRSPGGEYAAATRVMYDGTIDPFADAGDATVCIRPAMWLQF